MGFIGRLREGPFTRSWKVLVALAGLHLVGALGVAALVVLTVDESEGHAGGFAALAAVLFAAVGVVVFVVAVAFAWLLEREVAKPIVAIGLILAGWVPYWASGYFEGFLPVFVGALLVGALAIAEAMG